MGIGSGKASFSILCAGKDDKLHLIRKLEFSSRDCFIPEVGKTPLLDPKSTQKKLPNLTLTETPPGKNKQ